MTNTKQVFFARCADYDKARVDACVRALFQQAGGVETFLEKGRRVVIKPNLLMARGPDTATTTHPAVVEAVARLLGEAGASVTIADSPGGPYNEGSMARVYKQCGMEAAARAAGAALNRDFSSRKRRYKGEVLRQFDVIAPIAEADVIINIAKMKTHSLTYFTGAVKNNYGVVPGLTKANYHSQNPGRSEFAKLLVDLCQCVTPDFSIIDGVMGMDGKGPSGGRVRQGGVLIASKNPFAADLAAMRHCGMDPERAPVHQYAARLGLVPGQCSQLELLGDKVEPLAEPFVPAIRLKHNYPFINYLPARLRPALQRLLLPYPQISARCIGCGACARACPGKALRVAEGKARLDAKKCIQCYCCHELCPVKAIDL